MWHPAEFVPPEWEKAGSTETNKNRNIDNTINILMLLLLGFGIIYNPLPVESGIWRGKNLKTNQMLQMIAPLFIHEDEGDFISPLSFALYPKEIKSQSYRQTYENLCSFLIEARLIISFP